MTNAFLKYAPMALILACSGCSAVQPEEPTSSNFDIVDDAPVEVDFEADVNTTQYRSLSFSNATSANVVISNLAFVNNGCGAFSVFNVTDASGNVIYQSGDDVSVGVTAGASVSIQVKFAPAPCETKTYSTTLIVYYTDGVTAKTRSTTLNATVNDNTVNIVCPEKAEISYNDGIGDPTPSRKLPALPDGSYYYLKVERMRAYIQPTGGFTSMATRVGTDINAEQVAEEDRFEPVYLPFTTDDAGNAYLQTIDECSGFAIPSPVTDTYFWGAKVILTTAGVLNGTVDRSVNVGEVTFQDFAVRLFSNVNNGASLIQNEEGNFAVNLITDLTTGDSSTNSFLPDITDETDDDGEPLLNVVSDGDASVLRGTDLYHGTASFVGVGVFEGTDAMLSGEAQSALLDNEAYIFIQIDAKVVTKKE